MLSFAVHIAMFCCLFSLSSSHHILSDGLRHEYTEPQMHIYGNPLNWNSVQYKTDFVSKLRKRKRKGGRQENKRIRVK